MFAFKALLGLPSSTVEPRHPEGRRRLPNQSASCGSKDPIHVGDAVPGPAGPSRGRGQLRVSQGTRTQPHCGRHSCIVGSAHTFTGGQTPPEDEGERTLAC